MQHGHIAWLLGCLNQASVHSVLVVLTFFFLIVMHDNREELRIRSTCMTYTSELFSHHLNQSPISCED